jgi:peptidoglycan-associated lipoprotein
MKFIEGSKSQRGGKMTKVRSIGLIGLAVLATAALGGCGCFYQAVKGEKATPPPGAMTTMKTPPEGKKETGVEPQGAVKQATATPVVALKDIHFDFDRYTIRSGDTEILKQDLSWFKWKPDARVRIEGNCDERGTIEYNLALGQKRADAAKNYFVNLGVDGKLLETISYGKERPVDPGHNEQAWAKNRRDHFATGK